MSIDYDTHKKLLANYEGPLVKVVLSVFRLDNDFIGSAPFFLLGRLNKDVETETIWWKFPSRVLKYGEKPEAAIHKLLTDCFPGVKVSRLQLAKVSFQEGVFSPGYILSLHYVMNYISGDPSLNEFYDQFSWLKKEQIEQMPNVGPYALKSLTKLEDAINNFHHDHDELLVEVDKDDNEIGSVELALVHTDPRRYHRSAQVLLFNSEKNVILQLRSSRKKRLSGIRSTHGGHVAFGQKPEQTAHHELMEEIGVDTKLNFSYKHEYNTDKQSEFVYVYYGFHDGPYDFNRNEVDAVKTFDPQELLDGLYDDQYVIMPWVKKYLEEMKNVWS